MSWNTYDYDRVELTLADNKITGVKNLLHLKHPSDFGPLSNETRRAKIYIVLSENLFLYVGATVMPIGKKLELGLRAAGQKGHHGYPWKRFDKVEVIVYSFRRLSALQMEAVEAELVFQIRKKYGKWPEFQNEIHFNNNFSFARTLADDIFESIESGHARSLVTPFKQEAEALFQEPSQYGLRGDPYLWKDLKGRFLFTKITTLGQFKEFLHTAFKDNTGHLPEKGKNFPVTHFNFGGMSSGMVNSDFWIEKGFPLLEKRFNDYLAGKF